MAEAKCDSARQSVTVLTVTFKSDYLFEVKSPTLLPDAYDQLERVDKVLQYYPEISMTIAGHTDNDGSAQYNQKLSG